MAKAAKKKTKKNAVKKFAKKIAIRREWTKDDVRNLKALAKTKIGVAKIARQLKRTASAIAAKASLLGVSLNTRG